MKYLPTFLLLCFCLKFVIPLSNLNRVDAKLAETCTHPCIACQNTLYFLKLRGDAGCMFSQCPGLCMSISGQWNSGENNFLNFFKQDQINICETCFRANHCHINDCILEKTIIHHAIAQAVQHYKPHTLIPEPGIFANINKKSNDFFFNMDFIFKSLDKIVNILEQYENAYQNSIKLKKFLKIVVKFLAQKNNLNLSDINLNVGIDIEDENILNKWNELTMRKNSFLEYYMNLKTKKKDLNFDKIYTSNDIQNELDRMKNAMDFNLKVRDSIMHAHNAVEIYRENCNKNLITIHKLSSFVDVIRNKNIKKNEKLEILTGKINLDFQQLKKLLNQDDQSIQNLGNVSSLKIAGQKIKILPSSGQEKKGGGLTKEEETNDGEYEHLNGLLGKPVITSPQAKQPPRYEEHLKEPSMGIAAKKSSDSTRTVDASKYNANKQLNENESGTILSKSEDHLNDDEGDDLDVFKKINGILSNSQEKKESGGDNEAALRKNENENPRPKPKPEQNPAPKVAENKPTNLLGVTSTVKQTSGTSESKPGLPLASNSVPKALGVPQVSSISSPLPKLPQSVSVSVPSKTIIPPAPVLLKPQIPTVPSIAQNIGNSSPILQPKISGILQSQLPFQPTLAVNPPPIVPFATPQINVIRVAPPSTNIFNKNIFKPSPQIDALAKSLLGIDLNPPFEIDPNDAVNKLGRSLGLTPVQLPTQETSSLQPNVNDHKKEEEEYLKRNENNLKVAQQTHGTDFPQRKKENENENDDEGEPDPDDNDLDGEKSFLQKRTKIHDDNLYMDLNASTLDPNSEIVKMNSVKKMSLDEVKASANEFLFDLKKKMPEIENILSNDDNKKLPEKKNKKTEEESLSMSFLSKNSNTVVNSFEKNLKELDDKFFEIKNNLLMSMMN